VREDAVHLVLGAGASERWRGTETIAEGEHALEDATVRLLARAPTRWFEQLWLVASIGCHAARLKPLPGLPATANRDDILGALQTDPDRFFLQDADGAALLGVTRVDDQWMGAAASAATVSAVLRATEATGVRLVGCMPAVAAIAARSADGARHWRDGTLQIELEVRDRAVAALRVTPLFALVPGTAGADPAGQQPDDAAAAAFVRTHDLLYDPSLPRRRHARRRRFRLGVAVLAAASLMLAATAPGIRGQLAASAAADRLQRLRPSIGITDAEVTEIERAMLSESSIRNFASSRRSAVDVLAALDAHLPNGSAVISLRVDDRSVYFVALTPVGAPVVPSLAQATEFRNPRLIGPVTLEMVGGTELERIALQLERN
jgi:hypothetical protein